MSDLLERAPIAQFGKFRTFDRKSRVRCSLHPHCLVLVKHRKPSQNDRKFVDREVEPQTNKGLARKKNEDRFPRDAAQFIHTSGARGILKSGTSTIACKASRCVGTGSRVTRGTSTTFIYF